MFDKNDPQYHYKRIAAAEEQLERQGLLDYYIKLYKQKYRAEPIFPVTAAVQTQIKDLQRIMKERSYDAITAYFQIHDKWFEQQHYSLACLLKNLSKINVQIQRNTTRVKMEGKLSVEISCDCCWKKFKLVCDANVSFLDKPVRCEECAKSGARVKIPSKEERRAAVLKLGNAFPDMPRTITEEEKNEKLQNFRDMEDI